MGAGKRTPRRGPFLERVHRPPGVPVGDEDHYRGWFARNLAQQIVASADAGQLDRLEHEAKVLLATVRQWRGYGVPPGSSDDA